MLLQVLPDLLTELDAMTRRERLLSLVQGILAANIFDWGAKACVELYTNGTILDIYREVRGGACGLVHGTGAVMSVCFNALHKFVS